MRAPRIGGIKATYPRLPFGLKFRGYLSASRPFTLLGPIVGVFAAYGMAIHYGYTHWGTFSVEWRRSIYGLVTLILITAGSNLVNQATDFVEDAITKKWRPGPRGILTRDELHTLGVLLWLFAVLRAATLGVAFGGLVTLIVAISFLYSHPPVRLKSRLWLGNVSIATARGLLGLPAAWTLFAPIAAPEPWLAGVILFIFLVGATTSKDFGDAHGDAKAGIRNLVTRYGPGRAQVLSLPFILSPIFAYPAACIWGSLDYYVISHLFISFIILRFAYEFCYGNEQNRVLEGSRAWAWHYFSMLSIMALLAIPRVPGLI